MPERKLSKLAFLASIVTIAFTALAYSHVSVVKQDNEKILNFSRAQILFDQGLSLFKSENIEGASRLFSQALKRLPEHAEACFYLGLCCYRNGNCDTALVHFEEAKKNYLRWQAIVYDHKLHQQMVAREVAAWIDQVEMTDETGSKDRANCAVNQDRVREAGKLANAKHPSAEIQEVPAAYYFHSGNCYMKLEKHYDAYRQFAKAVEIDPTYGGAHNNLAILCFMAEQYVDSWLHLQLAKKNGAAVSPDFEKKLVSRMQQ